MEEKIPQEETAVKRALILALSFALACTLAACGGTDNPTTSTDPADTSTAENTTEPADAASNQGGDGNGTEKVITIDDEDGTIYGTITLSSWLDTGNDEFTFWWAASRRTGCTF